MKVSFRIFTFKTKFVQTFSLLLIAVFVLFGFFNNIWAQTIPDTSEVKSIKVGLALSGGGARGIAHVGVIQALEQEGIPIDVVAGTSMGSIVGGLYAAGYSSSAQRNIVKQIDWKGIFNQQPAPEAELISKRYGIMKPLIRFRFKFWEIYLPFGLNNGQRISNELFQHLAAPNFAAGSDFDSLTVPYRAMAVDASTGEVLALGKGELAQAIRASMAIPFVFYPARFEDRLLIDGGVLNMLPTDVVREMGADVVIACSLEELFPLGEEPKHIADVALHTLDITIRELKKKNMKLADVLIEPDLRDHSGSDYTGLDSLIEYGYQAAMAKMDKIKKIVPARVRKTDPSIRQLNHKKLEQAVIRKINVNGLTHVRQSVVIREFPLKKGERYNKDLVFQGIENIYATGLFENVWLELDNLGNNQVGINIHVMEKYPRTIGFGLNYREDEGLNGFVQIVHFNFFGWGERFMPSLRLGNVYKRAGLEIVNDRFFASPVTLHNGLYYEQENPYLYDGEGSEIGRLELDRVKGQFSVGVHLYRKLLLMAGIGGERVWLEKNQQIGLSANTFEQWSGFGQVVFDNTDDYYFPHKGFRLLLKGESVVDINFNALPYTKFQSELSYYFPLSKSQTISAFIFAGTSINGLPIYEKFRVGGPVNLPGYHRDELWGDHVLFMRLNYRIKFFKRWYFQTNLSMGNVNDSNLCFDNSIKGISTGLLADSPFGPVSILYGWSEKNRSQFNFSLGYDF